MIAYSSIAHAGYLFYAFLGDGPGRFQAVVFYLLAYGLMNVLAFASIPPNADDATRDRLDTLRGLFHRDPYAAVMIGIAMLSLAGIPPFPGFVAKFLIFKNVIAAGYTMYAVLGLDRQLPRDLLLPARDPDDVHEPGGGHRHARDARSRGARRQRPLPRPDDRHRGVPGLGLRAVLRRDLPARRRPGRQLNGPHAHCVRCPPRGAKCPSGGPAGTSGFPEPRDASAPDGGVYGSRAAARARAPWRR